MKSTLRRIGNSKGVLIPAGLLAACSIEDEIDIRIDKGRIIIAPINAPRVAWFDGYSEAEGAEARAWIDADLSGDSEWAW